MKKGRLEAFSDGVIAIIITIMVLELKVPHGASPEEMKPLLPVFLSYVLSFINVAIYWNNHHHMLHAVENVNGKVLWSNVLLLFFLSLIPFFSGWMGENHFARWPVVLYGLDLLMCALSFSLLSNRLIKLHGKDSALAKATGDGRKGKISVALYSGGVVLAFLHPLAGFLLYVIVAAIWFIPDKRIEKKLEEEAGP